MRRVDRIRLEKRRRAVLIFGLAFTLGALTAGGLIWRLDQLAARPLADLDLTRSEPSRELVITTPPAETAVAPAATATSGSDGVDADVVRLLRARRLEVPVEGVAHHQLRDSFDERRAGGLRRHEAIDIMAPKHTRVVAVEDGRVAKLFRSVAGGLTVYLFDSTEMVTYYYAHLDRYAPGLEEGRDVRRGAVIGYVGSTGNASEDAPHLHFAIFQLGPERRWWQGEPINPYVVLR
jgi:murein DD-endopeptidase MepM/ murein hydrolase activator NlpD